MAIKRRQNSDIQAPSVIPSRGGDIVRGHTPEETTDPTSLPRLQPADVNPIRVPFLFLHTPSQWEFTITKARPEGEWLPSLEQFYLMPGASRVQHGSLSLARTVWTQRGAEEVKKHLGPGGQSYVKAFDVVTIGKGQVRRIYMSCFDYLILNGQTTERRFDAKGFREWLRELVALGHIKAPPRHVAIDMVRKKQARIERLVGLPADNAATGARIESEQKKLKLMAASFAKQFGFDPLDKGAEDEVFGAEVRAAPGLPDQSGEEAIG